MEDLLVIPRGETVGEFEPKYHNWKRKAKVPILVLNATTLNSCHDWQFTATYMGEPPASINTEVDANGRFRRVYYRDLQRIYGIIFLGDAVAASACVPGLFPPFSLSGVYPGYTIRLVDGGVHDNQGLVGLLEQDCQVLLVSDASGQTGLVQDTKGSLSGILRA